MYKPESRQIYKYWNGTKEVHADPRKILNGFLDYPESSLEHDFKLLQVPDPKEQLAAYHRIISCARKAFNLAELDEDGVGATDDEVMGTFVDFGLYVDTLKKSTVTTPSLPLSTESVSSVVNSPTNVILGSG